MELNSNNIDVCFVSETWLNPNISSNFVCPNGYNILRNDRSDSRKGSCVAILYKNDWKILNVYPSEDFECLWCEIQKDNAKYYVAVLYHPPNLNYSDCELLEYLSDKCEEILCLDSSARIIIAGDINKLAINDLCTQPNLQQLVSKSTRGQRILDIFITSCPYLWKKPSVFKGLVKSDHMAIIVNPCVQAKPERKYVYFGDVREHRKINMEKCFQKCDWSAIYKANNVDEAITLLNDKIFSIFNECFPLIKVKVSTRDPPYMSPLVKHLCNKRNKQIKIGANPDIQERINKLIRLNQVRSVNEENRKFKQGSRKWWDT